MSRLLACLALALVWVAPAVTATPPNDSRSKAIELSELPATVEATTAGATAEASDPKCGAPARGTVWYRFEPDRGAPILVKFKASGELDVVVAALAVENDGQLKLLRCELSDSTGRARFAFESKPDVEYRIMVGQRVNSTAGAFRLDVSAPERPSNDERVGARQIGPLPSKVWGTTVGATGDEVDPCWPAGRTVWFRLDRARDGLVVVRLQAGENLDEAVLCVVRKVRSQLEPVARDTPDRSGRAAFSFAGKKGASYYVLVGQDAESEPGEFRLELVAPTPLPTPPGRALPADGGRGQLDPLQDRADAWAVPMTRGVTYRIGLLPARGRCLTAEVYPPGLETFAKATPLTRITCEGTRLFTPGPDGGGTYSLRVSGAGASTTYKLVAGAAAEDDMGPGVLLASGERRRDSVTALDPLDLYRFDALRTSDVRVIVGATADLGIRLADAAGRTIARGAAGRKLIRVVEPGTYYVAVSHLDDGARYTMRVLVRDRTETELTVNDAESTTVVPGSSVRVRTTTEPSAGGGRTRVQADYYDVFGKAWMFREVWDVTPGTSFTFTPKAVGQWRLRATFYGTDTASPSRTDYRTVTVASIDPRL